VPISSTSRARSIAVAGAALLLPLTVSAGCSASFGAQTQQPYQAADGVNADSGPIAARNILVIADAQGKGVLNAVLVNNGTTDDRLASVAVDRSVQGVAVAGPQQQPLPAGEAVPLGTRGKAITITGAKPGQLVKLTLSFASAGPITASIPVISQDHYGPATESGS
jgi:hypothetical protein